MPTALTYPGVYIEEIPSGVRAITGVSTSDTAFVDFFARGPLNKAVRITSFGDFERKFGGLDTCSEASYAVQQYYRNGGSIAWVVRVLAGNATSASITLKGGSLAQNTLTVKASSPGDWGNSLQVGVDYNTPDSSQLFNFVVRLVRTVDNREEILADEIYRNLAINDKTSRSYAPNVVNKTSDLIRLEDEGLGELPIPLNKDADVIGNPQSGDFYELGSTGYTAGDDGDTPPRYPGDPGGKKWIEEAGSGAAAIVGKVAEKTGFYALEEIAPFIFNIMCIPAAAKLKEANMKQVYTDAAKFCQDKRAFLIVDIPPDVKKKEQMIQWINDNATLRTDYAAVYFPRLEIGDQLNDNRPREVGSSGTIAGVYARTDAGRGIWKAPAGTDATLEGTTIATQLTDLENGALNQLGVNVLRTFPIFGNICWGARTMDGADQQTSEWKYIPVRRTALYIEESLYQGLKWVVFEPNDEPLWAQIRLNVGAFMNNLFRQGAFQGKTPREAYFVKCDKETTTQNDIDRGIVNILVGFAPLKPAEFVVIKIQQMAGQIET
jgi:phage tail sheath protein FI